MAEELTGRSAGQAVVELLAAIPLLALAASIALQLLLTGYALVLADGAAEAGALALAAGRPAKAAAEGSLPQWAEGRVDVAVSGGEVTVRLVPPSPIAAIGERLAVTSSSFARPGGR
ncbi:MAG TPA: hypothetical protein VG816_03325 [Solirubrobacterales bacterium]|nr:hypothetical protein [Solirubrobacterales bacterium]